MATGAGLFTAALESYGVTHVFGNPGTTELPIMDALSESDLSYVLGLHEDVAVGMAAGYAKARSYDAHADPTINPAGVVNLHIAPGLAHGLGNIFDASFTRAPLVVTAGNHPLDHQHHEPNLGGGLARMARPHVKWSAEVTDVDALPTMVRRAFRVALSPPTGPAFLALPLDIMMAETDDEPERLGEIPLAGPGDPRALDRVAEALAAAEEPVLVVGDGVAQAGPDAVTAAVDVAEALGAAVHGEFKMSEVCFPQGHPQWVGRLPRDQTTARDYLDGDVVCFCGISSNTPTNPVTVDFVPADATLVHVATAPYEIGKNEPADIAVMADPGHALRGLAERLVGAVPEGTVEERQAAAAELREAARAGSEATRTAAGPDDGRATNATLAAALHEVAPDAVLVAEAPTSVGAFRSRFAFDHGQFFQNRGGGLGYGLPASVGMAVAEAEADRPARDIVALVGDGSYLYYPQSLYSAARYDLDLTVLVPDNRNYRILKDNTLRILGGEEADYDFVGMDFDPAVDIPASAEANGATGYFVGDREDVVGTLETAISESGPAVVDVLTRD